VHKGAYPGDWPAMIRALRRAVETRRLRVVASEVGMSWTGLRTLLLRPPDPLRVRDYTLTKITRWYAKHGDPGEEAEKDAVLERLLLGVSLPLRDRVREYMRALLDQPEKAQLPPLTPELINAEFLRQLPLRGWGEAMETVATLFDARRKTVFPVSISARAVASGVARRRGPIPDGIVADVEAAANENATLSIGITGLELANACRSYAAGLSKEDGARKPMVRRVR
jgi:hypothetical protein